MEERLSHKAHHPNKGTQPLSDYQTEMSKTNDETVLNSWRCYRSIELRPRILRRPFN